MKVVFAIFAGLTIAFLTFYIFQKITSMQYGTWDTYWNSKKQDCVYQLPPNMKIVYRYPNLLFLFLTKRPSNINKYIPAAWKDNPPANVMFGTSPVNQETADKLIPQLLEVKGKKFLSVEPMLDKINLYFHYVRTGNLIEDKIDWVICGGESGPGKRPFNPDWARSLRDQCKTAGVPFFMKQIDKVQPIPEDLLIKEFPAI